MSFTKEFPKQAFQELVKLDYKSPLFPLAVYDLVGFALAEYFGNLEYPAQFNLGSVQKLLEASQLAKEIVDKAKELKATNLSDVQVGIQLFQLYGWKVITLAAQIKDALV